MDWYRQTPKQVTQALKTDEEAGLTSDEATRRLATYGTNELIDPATKSPWRIFLTQFTEIMVIILLIAAVISLILGEYIDVAVILAIVFLNAIIGFSQEYRAEQAMAALKQMAVPTVRVRRDGELHEVSSTDIVPGDIVVLEAGNIVPADGRLLQSMSIKAQESALTGESEPVEKHEDVIIEQDAQVGDRVNMLYMGTVITYGRGRYVVTETGMSTELGKIADLIQSVEEDQTPLQRRMAHLGKTLAWAALAIIVVMVLLGLFRGVDLETLFLTAVSLAVAVIPESLPAIVTITLALGSQRLLKRNALIRKLPAVETLGSVTVICSDKTGTLTENKMTVTILDVAGNTQDINTLLERKGSLLQARLVTDSPPDLTALSVLIRAATLCNDAILKRDESGECRAIGDPTEGALVLAANHLGYNKDELEQEWPRVAEVPFTSERKRMTTVHKMSPVVRESDVPWSNAPYLLVSKGAVDSLLEITSSVLVDNEIVPIDDTMRQRIESANANLAQQGQRVLGVAFRILDVQELPRDETVLESEEIFVGLIAMIDPPRPEVKEAVKRARTAGIRPVMITGDHPLTALRIAEELDIAQDGTVMTGKELATISANELEGTVDSISVYARVAPEHKLNIVQALQNKGQITAMTGDGVNDAPALKRADIGVAMGITGTDVSKEAADMVLLDDNFATIVAAVEEGRVVYDNVRKFIKYALSSNVGELFVMIMGPIIGMPLPLLPLQILWINLVTDGLPGLALAIEPGEQGIMRRPPHHPKDSIFSRGLGTQIIWIGVLMGLVAALLGYIEWRIDPNGPWQTMVFTTLVVAQMGNALATRSSRGSLFSIGVFSNRLMVWSVLLTLVLQALLLYVPFLQNIFNTSPLSARQLGICLIASVAIFTVIELYKWVQRRSQPA